MLSDANKRTIRLTQGGSYLIRLFPTFQLIARMKPSFSINVALLSL